MKKIMKNKSNIPTIISVLLVILSILLFFNSEITIIAISYIIGASLVGIGGVAIIKFIKNIKSNITNELEIVYGIVAIILGLIIILNPKAIASIIPVVIGTIIIISSTIKLQKSIENRNNKKVNIPLIISICSLIVGLFIIFNPFQGAVLITKGVSIFIMAYGVLDIVSSIIMKKEDKSKDKEKIPDAEIISEEEVSK